MKFKFYEQYYSDKEKGVTICAIILKNPDYLKTTINNLLSIYRDCNSKEVVFKNTYKNMNIPKIFVGTARLAKDDTWDENIGKRIAREKAFKTFSKMTERFESIIKNISHDISSTYSVENFKANKKIEKPKENNVEKKIKKLVLVTEVLTYYTELETTISEDESEKDIDWQEIALDNNVIENKDSHIDEDFDLLVVGIEDV